MKLAKDKKLAYVTIAVTIGYIFWRIFRTFPSGYGWASIILGCMLLIAEIVGLIEQIIHYHMMSEIEIPLCPVVDEIEYPTVDVFIATYNEPAELLYKTINGCVHMDYPDKSKVKIYVCDDGGRDEIKQLAKEFQVNYLARQEHSGAKAGNLNHALQHSSGKLIVTFDADMIPKHDFLTTCVPYFMTEISVGFVQTPQSFYNLDLFQYNLFAETIIPNEQDYFYHDIELAKNKSNSVIYGGSNTVLSRKALEDIGGFVTNVITEDFATGMLIQSKRYVCFAIDEVLASGLAPSDLESLVKQRRRWARGCIQTGRKLKILTRKGLNFQQKISYLSSISYWYDSIKRLLYMISPLLFIFFHVRALKANALELLLIWFPMYAINIYTIRKLSGNRRTIRWTNIYETIMLPLLIKDVILEMFGFSETKFRVTNKDGKRENQRYQIRMAIPHMILALLTFIGILKSVIFIFTTGSMAIAFVLFWLVINLYNLLLAIFFMIGRKAYRKYERFQITTECEISYGHNKIQAMTYDISEGGCSVMFSQPVYLPPDEVFSIQITNERYNTTFHAEIVQVFKCADGYRYSFCMKEINATNYRELLQILHDRIPPLTKYIDTGLGLVDELRNNIQKRLKKHMLYQRKLPRIQLNYTTTTLEGFDVTITSFNYLYLTLETTNAWQNIQLQVDEQLLMLSMVKEQGEAYLYEIVNVDELCLTKLGQTMMTLAEQGKEKDTSNSPNEKVEEFDEMAYL